MRKFRAILLQCMLAFAVTARAGIVIDDAQPDTPPTATPAAVPVPKPLDTGAATPTQPDPNSDILLFANKDVLHGIFLGCDKAGLRWQCSGVKDPSLFQTEHIFEAKLDSRKPPANAAPPTHSVLLTNGDELSGVLISLDDTKLLLDTWYAGRLTIPRGMVGGIISCQGGASLYEGPTGLEEWTNDTNNSTNWSYHDGTLIAGVSAKIGRDMKLPDLSRTEFDVAYSSPIVLTLLLYCDSVHDNHTSYTLQFNGNTVSLGRYLGGNLTPLGQTMQLNGQPALQQVPFQAGNRPGMTRFWQQSVAHNGQQEKLHIDVRVNKQKKLFRIFVNGTQVIEASDAQDFVGTGGFVAFYAPASVQMQVSHIKVSAWDGATVPESTTASKEDVMMLGNGDHISGKLKEIAGGKAVLSGFGPNGDLSIPLERIASISIATGKTEKIKYKENDVRAFFANEGSVTLELESWDAKQITVTSPDFGNAVFSPDAFQRLQFNPGNPPPPPDDPVPDAAPPTRTLILTQ